MEDHSSVPKYAWQQLLINCYLDFFAAFSDFDTLGPPGVAPPATRGLWFL